VLDQSLDDSQVATEAGDVERCPEVVGSSVNNGAKFDQDFDQGCMTLIRGEMKGCKSV